MTGEGGNFNIREWQERRRNLFEQRAAIDADIKENGLEGKAFAVNVAAFDKWLKAETKDASVPHGKEAKAIAKLIEATVDQVVYGESLGHDLGMLQNNRINENHTVENNSSEAATVAPQSVSAIEADTDRAPDPLPSGVATGGTVEPSPVVPPTQFPAARPSAGNGGCPTNDQERGDAVRGQGSPNGEHRRAVKSSHAPDNSNPVTAASREASTAGKGGAETVTAPPEPIHVTDDDLDLPRSMNRANWIDGSPPR